MVRVLAIRKGWCRCKHVTSLQTLATDVPDAIPIEIHMCRLCDGPGPWAPQAVFGNLDDSDDLG
jgi:hypothetical protein